MPDRKTCAGRISTQPVHPTGKREQDGFARVLGHPVDMEAVPCAAWEDLFRSQGMCNPTLRAQMLDGFNEGWISFESTTRRGVITIDTMLAELVSRAG